MNYEDSRCLKSVQIVHTDLPQEKQTKWRAFYRMMGIWLRQGDVKREWLDLLQPEADGLSKYYTHIAYCKQ